MKPQLGTKRTEINMSNSMYSGYPQYATPSGGGASRPLKHSGMGLASLIIGIFCSVWELVVIVIAGVLHNTPGRTAADKASQDTMVGGLICGSLVFVLVGLGLGIASLFQRDRKKILGILGVVFNGLIILGVIGLMLLGFAVMAARGR
jgi:hypothetical protein